MNEERRHTGKEVFPPLVRGIDGGRNMLNDKKTEIPLLFSLFPHITSLIKRGIFEYENPEGDKSLKSISLHYTVLFFRGVVFLSVTKMEEFFT